MLGQPWPFVSRLVCQRPSMRSKLSLMLGDGGWVGVCQTAPGQGGVDVGERASRYVLRKSGQPQRRPWAGHMICQELSAPRSQPPCFPQHALFIYDVLASTLAVVHLSAPFHLITPLITTMG